MSKWINVKDKLPKHKDIVIAQGKHYPHVVMFLDMKIVKEELIKMGREPDNDATLYEFASIEAEGACLGKVTYWMPAPAMPRRKND